VKPPDGGGSSLGFASLRGRFAALRPARQPGDAALRQRRLTRLRAAISLALVAATFAVYGRVAGHEFVDLDDRIVIIQNPIVREGLTAEGVVRAFREPAEANWVPLTWISLQLGYQLHGLAPSGFLLGNVALHALACVLLFLALLRLTAALWESAAIAALFALHPVHVESVAWAASRKDVLSGVFFMASLLLWARFAQRPSASRYLAVMLVFACGLLSKPTLVTTPFVLWLLDFWPLQRLAGASGARAAARRAAGLLLEKLPLLALSAAASAVAYRVQESAGALGAGAQIPFAWRWTNALDALRIYLAQSLWPSGLAVSYPHPLGSLGLPRLAAAAGLLALLTALALAGLRRRPYLIVGWLWFLGMLVPVIGLVQVGIQPHADRYLYLPQIGLSLALVFWVADLVRGRPRLRTAIAVASGVALAALALTCLRQVGTFRDSIALQSHAVAVTERNLLAHYRLGDALRRAGRLPQAERELRSALALAPRHVKIRIALADVLAQSGRGEEAVEHYRLANAADPGARALVLAALRRSAAERAAAGRADEAARLRAELALLAPRPK
jgi:tetratricopeptide (TPR) repeat protein